jgi:hypothetical protein
MALNAKISDAAANAAADAVVDLLDGGKLLIYDGSQPADADTAVTDQTLLAELTFGTPAFGDASGGVATANAITQDSSANATGTATWFRVTTSEDAAIFDGSVGTADANLVLNSVAIQAGATVSVTELTYTQPKSA